MASRLLSKSKYLSGLRCPLLLWTYVNNAGILPPVSTSTQHRFDEGNTVGHFAKSLFPEGIDIPVDNFIGNTRQTEKLLFSRKPLFEAGILSGRLYARADVLNPVENDAWDIYEVKSSTSIKEANIHDVAFQKFVYQQKGIKIGRCLLIYIDTNYVKHGEIDPKGLFKVEDISGIAEDASIGMEERIQNMFAVMDSKNRPECTLGSYCLSPWECDLKPVCWGKLPENHIFELDGSRAKKFMFYDRGILSIKDIPDEIDLTRKQTIQKNCIETGNIHVDRGELSHFLKKIEYPIYYLESATINPAIPIYDSTRPYQHVPFQFSLRIDRQPDLPPVLHSFLAEGNEDPRPAFLCKLKNLLGFSGSVIVNNAGFNKSILKELARAFPEYESWAESVTSRMVDILSPFNDFHYFDPAQKDFDAFRTTLSVASSTECPDKNDETGMDAGIAFLQIAKGLVTPEQAEGITRDLNAHCETETAAMVEILNKLREFAY